MRISPWPVVIRSEDRAAQEHMDDAGTATPTRFGRYELLELVGRGGMAEVFRARLAGAAGTEKLLCIKRILPTLSQHAEFLQLFISEARVALPLTHGNITQVFDFGEVDGVYYLAMEYVHGQNLARTLQRAQEGGAGLTVPAALYVAAEVCRGLQYAHGYADASGRAVAVVHRDVSPQNVLISYNGEVKLADFGIASAASKAPGGDAVLRGKPCYLSPEQAAGSAGDARSDIFALGAVLYEMLTGRRPFEAESDAQTLERVRTLEVEPPSRVNPLLDPGLDAIVLKALAKDPAARCQRAEELQVGLTGVLHRLAPDFTAQSLGALLRSLFAWEVQADQGPLALRDRLLVQLARAGVQVADVASTESLLEMATVAIGPIGATAARGLGRERRRRWRPSPTALLTLALATLAGIAVWIGRAPRPQLAVVADLGPPPEPTEHLTPPSLRARGADESLIEPRSAGAAEDGAAMATGSGSAPPSVTRAARSGRTAAQAGARALAYLNCNSWPWSVVYVDGRRLRGNTPLYQVKVVAGRRRLRFVNPELGMSKEVTVAVAPAQVRTVAVRLDPAPAADPLRGE